MTILLIEVDCDGDNCGTCEALDDNREWCNIFNQSCDGDRLAECIDAQDCADACSDYDDE